MYPFGEELHLRGIGGTVNQTREICHVFVPKPCIICPVYRLVLYLTAAGRHHHSALRHRRQPLTRHLGVVRLEVIGQLDDAIWCNLTSFDDTCYAAVKNN